MTASTRFSPTRLALTALAAGLVALPAAAQTTAPAKPAAKAAAPAKAPAPAKAAKVPAPAKALAPEPPVTVESLLTQSQAATGRGEIDLAVRLAQSREQDAQVVVHLGHRADRRAWALARRLLLDADGR